MKKRRKEMDVGAQHLRSTLSGRLGPDFVQVKMLYLSEHHIGFSFFFNKEALCPGLVLLCDPGWYVQRT